MDERTALIGLSLVSGIGPLRYKLLIDYFGSAAKAFTASEPELLRTGLSVKLTSAIIQARTTFVPVDFMASLARKEIAIITRNDSTYPQQLLTISDPPLVLYVRGTLPTDWQHAIAVIGTRKPTGYGRQVTEQLTTELVNSGCLIVSGLARGIDGIAHRTTLAHQGITVAVLGCGVDIVYPPEHRELYSTIIASGGAIISEVPPGHTVARGLFPARNRIISGLSRGVLVTEGAQDSGSLITARLALEQGREVFAVPGPINSYLSAGPTQLIKNGAQVVTEALDILSGIGLSASKSRAPIDPMKQSRLSNEERFIVDLLESGTLHFDDIVREALYLQVRSGQFYLCLNSLV